MMRLTAFFVAVCMVLIAGSFGAALYFVFGLSGAESSMVAVAALTGLGLYNTVSGRQRDRTDIGAQIADLSRGTSDLARQVAELGRRLAAAEVKVGTAVDMAVAAAKPVAAEIEELGALINQLAETVAAHDVALGGERPWLAASSAPTIAAAMIPEATSRPVAQPSFDPALNAYRSELGDSSQPASPQQAPSASLKAANGRFKGMEHDAIVAMICGAVETNRLDLYLQPIVTLPQRKVRFYEAMTRLRNADGEVLTPADFLPYAEEAGLMPKIDNLMLFRCVQVARRLLVKNREIGMFCNVSASTLTDPEFFPQFSEFMDANRALAPSLVLEFTQSAYRSLGPMENESLAALASRGFRFSMDNVSDLRLEPRDLGERGFRFLKVPAGLLLDRSGATVSDIHPADLAGLLARFGVELIGERIESEGVVVDLLDYDVKYGQGFLFSQPRPVRADIMQATPDRGEPAARETLPPLPAPMPRPAPETSPPARSQPAADGRPAGPRTSALGQLARGIAARG